MAKAAAWVRRLLAWFEENKREMPWRGHPDPYAVWVSEIMLQQTQVDTVRPYFTRFLKTFPTLEALAAAEESALLKAWEGLGYYSRVRNMQKAARQLVEAGAHALPSTSAQLQALPGIGAYTAAAIASICFGEPTPVVDGNVARVFARRNALTGDFKKVPARHELANWLTPHIKSSRDPSSFNQAMMELGALVCTPRNPKCEACPLRKECAAAKEGHPEAYPVAAAKKVLPTREGKVLLLRDTSGRLLLSRHSGERLLAGFWELPSADALPFAKPKRPKKLGTYQQTFSHFHLTLAVLTAPAVKACELPEGFCWCEDPAALPLTTATRKILAQYRKEER